MWTWILIFGILYWFAGIMIAHELVSIDEYRAIPRRILCSIIWLPLFGLAFFVAIFRLLFVD